MNTVIESRVQSLIRWLDRKEAALAHEWFMFVAWTDLLLLSWPIEPADLGRFVPAGVELDTFDGRGWLSLVPFRAEDMHFRGLPPFPGQSEFCELNVRTYVRQGDLKAVLFLSLDCPGRLADFIGQRLFHLPFLEADMRISRQGDLCTVESRRTGTNAPPASLVATYRPVGPAATPAGGTLEDFLTNRLSLFVERPDGSVYRADIGHAPWMLQPAEVTIRENTMAAAVGITLPDTSPHAAFAAKTDSVVYPPLRVR